MLTCPAFDGYLYGKRCYREKSVRSHLSNSVHFDKFRHDFVTVLWQLAGVIV